MQVCLGNLSCTFVEWRPEDGRVFQRFGYDSETTDIDDERPYLTPAYVLGAACDGLRGVFISREHLLAFFKAHEGAEVIMHNAAFDMKVAAPLLQPDIDIYGAVEENRIWDTMILKRLLSLATVGHTARGESSLANCAQEYLGVVMEKDKADSRGKTIRSSFGQFLGKSFESIPTEYLTYLGQDALATWHLFGELHRRIKEVLQNSFNVWGFVNEAPDHHLGGVSDRWLRDVIRRFGPLTHHIQLRVSSRAIRASTWHRNSIAAQTECDGRSKRFSWLEPNSRKSLRSTTPGPR